MRRHERWLVFATLASAAAWFVLFRLGEQDGSWPTYDIYAYFYPNILYALRAIRHGGRGLLWNPLQNCGQPFFANSQTGLLYPANLLFLVLDPDRALRGVLFVNLVVAGVSAYLLGRALRLHALAALAGALAFELGNSTAFMTVWAPMAAGPYVWFPAAMTLCERILRKPTGRRAVALGAVLALALLPGYPQTVLFICQVIVLRVVWELVTRRPSQPLAIVFAVGGGLILAALLAAVQLVPALEVARESIRSRPLDPNEIAVSGYVTWQGFRQGVGLRTMVASPLVLVPALVASTAFVRRDTRRVAIFYAATGMAYCLLMFGPSTPLHALYARLPLSSLFREPTRFVWVSSFCLAVLTGLGVDAVVSRGAGGRVGRLAGAVLAGAALLGFRLLVSSLRAGEQVLASVTLAAYLLVGLWRSLAPVAGAVLLGALAVNLVLVPSNTFMRLLANGDTLYEHAPAFKALDARLTPQDRVFIVPQHPRFSLMPKTASVFEAPSITDYEPQTSRRYAELLVLLRFGRLIRSLNDFYYPISWPTGVLLRPLLDLTGTRYLVVAAADDRAGAGMRPPLRLIDNASGVHVYENAQALPRASYVRRVEVVGDPQLLLVRLGLGIDDPRDVALLETAPPSGFTGTTDDLNPASVEIVESHPEHLVIRVDAPARGFLLLTDEYFPGWHATVNGAPTTILRANYAFRLVEVPTGASMVEFRYVPASVLLGAAISAATMVAVAWYAWRAAPRPT